MAKVKPETLTPEHVKAARAFLKWSAGDLAQYCEIGVATVRLMESGGKVRDSSRAAIMNALESHGIVFKNGGEPGVVLTKFRMTVFLNGGEEINFGNECAKAHLEAIELSKTRGQIIVESRKVKGGKLLHQTKYQGGKLVRTNG